MDEDASAARGDETGNAGFAAGRTHVGRIREHNEDAFLVRAPLYVVADGMGGHQAGEVASAHAVAELRGAFDAGRITSGPDLVRALCDAHEVIATDARRTPSRRGMGTTCVAALVVGSVAQVAHIGDSRAYLLRRGRLERLTEDHSLVAALIRDGVLREEDAERDPRRHIVLRALGADEAPRPDLRDVPLQQDDRLLLCSDGLSGYVQEDEIATLLAVGPPAEAADRLVARTLARGAPDNVTVIVIDAGAAGSAGAATAASAGGTATRQAGSRRRKLGAGVVGVIAVAVLGGVAVSAIGAQPSPAPASLLSTPEAQSAPSPTASPAPTQALPSAPTPASSASASYPPAASAPPVRPATASAPAAPTPAPRVSPTASPTRRP